MNPGQGLTADHGSVCPGHCRISPWLCICLQAVPVTVCSGPELTHSELHSSRWKLEISTDHSSSYPVESLSDRVLKITLK